VQREVYCVKLKANAKGLSYIPYPGELGKRIFNEVSEAAWSEWLAHQTMLINEYRLSLIDPEARQFLEQEMVNFLFGEGSKKPAGYVKV